mmetsp:Transcript_35363/g.77361  ORF Transcript_35363/g.77361 Transcript_35363/m.77361 type:complete len:222 (+) Transcript_35363:220-885(+)
MVPILFRYSLTGAPLSPANIEATGAGTTIFSLAPPGSTSCSPAVMAWRSSRTLPRQDSAAVQTWSCPRPWMLTSWSCCPGYSFPRALQLNLVPVSRWSSVILEPPGPMMQEASLGETRILRARGGPVGALLIMALKSIVGSQAGISPSRHGDSSGHIPPALKADTAEAFPSGLPPLIIILPLALPLPLESAKSTNPGTTMPQSVLVAQLGNQGSPTAEATC